MSLEASSSSYAYGRVSLNRSASDVAAATVGIIHWNWRLQSKPARIRPVAMQYSNVCGSITSMAGLTATPRCRCNRSSNGSNQPPVTSQWLSRKIRYFAVAMRPAANARDRIKPERCSFRWNRIFQWNASRKVAFNSVVCGKCGYWKFFDGNCTTAG